MKVLIVATDVPPYKGGISRIVGLLREGLLRLGYEVSIVGSKSRAGELKFSSIPFHRYAEFDVLHVHGPTPLLSDLMLLLHSWRKIVYTHHAEISYGCETVSKVYRCLHRSLALKTKAIIVHSLDYARLFNSDDRVVVIRPPCVFNNLIWHLNRKPLPFTVLFVGQLRPFKGIELLIWSASLLRDVRFFIVGNGYLKTKLLKMTSRLRLKNIRFFSNISDDELIDMYKRAHVICLPSINTTEAWGLVLTEGALFGCVPLASDLIGVRENVKLLKGLLFEPGSCKDLVEKIRMLSKNLDMWSELSQGCYEAAIGYVKTYSSDYYVKKHVEVFSEVAGESA